MQMLGSFVLRLRESTETYPFSHSGFLPLGSFVLRLRESTETLQEASQEHRAVVHSSFGSERALKPPASSTNLSWPQFIRPSAQREH